MRLAPGSPLSLVWGTCELYRGLLLSDTGALITKNAFLTSEELKVNPGTLPVPPKGYFTVDQAALLEDGIIFRIDGALYWRDNQDRVLTEHPQLPTSGVMGLYQRTCCASNYPVQVSISSSQRDSMWLNVKIELNMKIKGVVLPSPHLFTCK